MGPGGGIAGGRIIATGTPQDIKNNADCIIDMGLHVLKLQVLLLLKY